MDSAERSGLDLLVVSQYFHPEMGAPAQRYLDFGRLLIERGHRVRVLTGFPNFPSGRIPDDYRGELVRREWVDGIEVVRGWVFASPKLSPVTKAIGFASYTASASLWALLGGLSADVVIATSPPPTVGIPGILASRRLRAPLVFDVRDIWPEAIVLSGRLESPTLIRSLEAVERAIYRASSAVIVVTEGKRTLLMEKGVPDEKLAVIPNGVDLGRFDVEVDVDGVLRECEVARDRFVVMYAGIFGPSQGLDVLLDAAALSKKKGLGDRIQFVLMGAGVEKERLLGRRSDEGLGDLVVFMPEQPRELIPSLLRAADAIAVTLRPRRDAHTVPSKIYEAFASGKPVLVSADGAPAEIMEEAKGGFATPASDAAALFAAIQKLEADRELAARFGEAGRAYAAGYDRRRLVDRLEGLLERVAAKRKRQS